MKKKKEKKIEDHNHWSKEIKEDIKNEYRKRNKAEAESRQNKRDYNR